VASVDRRRVAVPRVDCPNCGAVVELHSVTRTADEFCPTPGCDYPLFWARGTTADADFGPPAEEVVRRRPGTGGRQVPSPERCPVCRELNRPTAVFCQRCGADMHPPPPPPPAPPAPPPAPPAAPPFYRRPSPWSDWRVVAVVLVLLVTFLLTATLLVVNRS
jgi:hypothetical protein